MISQLRILSTADPAETASSLLFGDDSVKQLKEAKEAISITHNLANDRIKKNYVKGARNQNAASHPPRSTSSYNGYTDLIIAILIIKHNHNQRGFFMEGPKAVPTQKETISGSINDIITRLDQGCRNRGGQGGQGPPSFQKTQKMPFFRWQSALCLCEKSCSDCIFDSRTLQSSICESLWPVT